MKYDSVILKVMVVPKKFEINLLEIYNPLFFLNINKMYIHL